ncbi:PDZ and LIM domain protein [Elysia marginata]|uniref:PDZ and LIM domain protein n=1 Tax=Elysia marginata TaxID=1093978 RepID=A0AAV4JLQ0_9GAST|nr:PDZ and LIM domain protein [Elysia marginata]
MASVTPDCVQLRRRDTSQNWGFRMQGGREYGLPLFIVAVSPKGLAGKAGLLNGDEIVQICQTNVQGWTHTNAKSEMMRAGNEVDLWVIRGSVDVSDPAIKEACGVGKGQKRVELDECSINPNMNEGNMFRNVTPKTYKILEAQLAQSEPEPDPTPAAQQQQQPSQSMKPIHAQPAPAAQGKPSSIFDRKKTDRSDYLKAQGQTIQKAYGQQY